MKVLYLEKEGFNKILEALKDIEVSASLSIKRNRKTKSIKYYDLPAGFDIETTSTYIDQEKSAWLYEWTFGVKDSIIIGRKAEDLKTLFYLINLVFNRGRLLIYVHNLEFEFQFIRKWFKDIEVFSSESRKVIKAVSKNLEFRDSYILSGLSLAKTAENLVNHKIEKLYGDLDYSIIRFEDTPLSEKEYQYCINDVIIILYYIEEQITQFGNITKIPLTNTGRVRNYCRDNTIYTKNRIGDKVLNQSYIKRIKESVLDPDIYLMSKSAFRGGTVHSSLLWTNKTLKKVSSYDLRSAYPAAMIQFNYPVGKPYLIDSITKEEFNDLIKKHCLLFNAEFTNLRLKDNVYDCYLSLITSKMKVENYTLHNGRIYEASYLNIDLIDIDLEIIDKVYDYDDLKINKTYIWKKESLPKELIECILYFYNGKTTLKGIPEKFEEYMNLKGMLNSTYGMIVQDPLKDEAIYENGIWRTEDPVLDKLNDYNTAFSRFLYYPQGLWVTAYCRFIIWNAIIECGEDYVYCDTDSVKILNKEKHSDYFEKFNNEVRERVINKLKSLNIDPEKAEPKNIKGEKKLIGVFDYEGTYDEFKTLGAKRYLIRKGLYWELTCAGVSKEAVKYIIEQGGFNAFNLSLEIPANYTGKLTHSYLDNNLINVINNHIVQSESAIHLEPAEYSMNPDKNWLKFLLNYNRK